MKRRLTEKKEENDKKALKQLNENKKIDQINSVPLKNYYRKTLVLYSLFYKDIFSRFLF